MDPSSAYQNYKKYESLFDESSSETTAYVSIVTAAMTNEDRNDAYVQSIELNSTKINIFNNHIYMLKVSTSDSCAICTKIMGRVCEIQRKFIIKFQLFKERN